MKNQKGITTIEVLVCIAILAIITTIGIPSFRQFIESQHQDTTVVRLTDTLRQSRMEALRLKQNVYLCATTNGTSCSGSNNWSTGWLAYADKDRNGQLGQADTILMVQQEQRNTLSTTASSSTLRFYPNGLMQSATFDICSSALASKNNIAINPAGYISFGQTNVAHC